MDLARAVQWLVRAESEIALLARARPLEFSREFERLAQSWCMGRVEAPVLRYRQRSSLDAVKSRLAEIIELRGLPPLDGTAIRGRAAELLLEARLAESVGCAEFVSLAAERFPAPGGAFGRRLESTAREWVAAAADSVCAEPTFVTDDVGAPQSLWSVLSARLGQLRLPVRLRVEPHLVSVAACGEDVIVVRSGTRLTERAARRVTEHEVVGHLLPRLASRGRVDALRCGCPRAAEDEEGRALIIESRLGLSDIWRRAELGARHLACVLLRRGGTFIDVVRTLQTFGAPTNSAIRAALRAFRGGGLGREIIYLPAMARLERAFDARPELEQWFECGRASLEYAEALRARGRAA